MKSFPRGIPEAIAFGVLCSSAVFLEYAGKGSWGLWTLVGIWALGSDWGQKEKNDDAGGGR